jgi:hypothetical protein
MGFAREYARTGDPHCAQMTLDIVAGLAPYQNKDGSFPHWCAYSEDVHYTDWMAQELILIERLVDDPAIEPLLARMDAFLEARVGDDGVTRYQGPCPYEPLGCVLNYWSLGTGCSIDVETPRLHERARLHGAPVRPRRLAQAPGGARVPRLDRGRRRGRRSLGRPDRPEGPLLPVDRGDTSVVNMSLLFWSLAAMPPAHGPNRAIAGPSPPRTLAIAPNPASGMVMIGAPELRGAHAAGMIRDVRGRIVRSWAGPAFTWDGPRTNAGEPARPASTSSNCEPTDGSPATDRPCRRAVMVPGLGIAPGRAGFGWDFRPAALCSFHRIRRTSGYQIHRRPPRQRSRVPQARRVAGAANRSVHGHRAAAAPGG